MPRVSHFFIVIIVFLTRVSPCAAQTHGWKRGVCWVPSEDLRLLLEDLDGKRQWSSCERELFPANFDMRNRECVYRIYREGDKAWLSFERPGDPSVKGTRELLYYIGSNRTGRSYLFSTDGFLFESPVNWYAQKGVWDMTPAYQDAREIPLNLPAVADCLTCHTSGMTPPIAGTENRYSAPAIKHAGVTCQRCHGEDVAHARRQGPYHQPDATPSGTS